MRYAALMSILTVTFAATSPPGDGDILGPPAPALLGFIDITSKACAIPFQAGPVPPMAATTDLRTRRTAGRRPLCVVHGPSSADSGFHDHSHLSADIGSILVARRAGK